MKEEVIQGDCLEVMKDIDDKSIDMILCDLPYGTTKCKWDTIIPFEPLWEQYKRIIKDNGAIVLTASQPFTSALVMSNVKMYHHDWCWKKQGLLEY
jgi:site-specific DNA-methyltransferase (adenine-specific)